MRRAIGMGVGVLLGLAAATVEAQLLPPPRDGDIRVVYWELQDQTEVWLTLEPRSPRGEKLPISLALAVRFAGKRPAAAPNDVEVRASVNLLWAPEPRLTLWMDGEEPVEFAPPGPSAIYNDPFGEGMATISGMAGTISMATLDRMTAARSLGGNALRLDFELDASQRAAIARFAERVRSADPARASGRP